MRIVYYRIAMQSNYCSLPSLYGGVPEHSGLSDASKRHVPYPNFYYPHPHSANFAPAGFGAASTPPFTTNNHDGYYTSGLDGLSAAQFQNPNILESCSYASSMPAVSSPVARHSDTDIYGWMKQSRGAKKLKNSAKQSTRTCKNPPECDHKPQPAPSVPDANKRPRHTYKTEQTVELEKEFLYEQYLKPERRKELAKQLKLTDRQVKIWFQNRRMKKKRSTKEIEKEMRKREAEQGGSQIVGARDACSDGTDYKLGPTQVTRMPVPVDVSWYPSGLSGAAEVKSETDRSSPPSSTTGSESARTNADVDSGLETVCKAMPLADTLPASDHPNTTSRHLAKLQKVIESGCAN